MFALLTILAIGACRLAYWLSSMSSEKLGIPHDIPPIMFLGAFVVGLVGIGLMARLLLHATVPVSELMKAVARVESGDYTARVGERGPREMRALVRAFNDMVERLQLNETQRRNLLADVTHELRTPLTVIQGNLEGLLDGVYPRDDAHLGPILEDARVLARLIDDLRTLSLAESGALHLHREPTDFAVLAGETVASFRTQAEAVGVDLSVSMVEDLPLLEIDPLRIREVLANLIMNALHYTPAGGKVQVTGQLDSANRFVSVSVSDTGVGISAEALPHIFDRFYKSGNSRGTGLGLAIAKNLITAHGGQISARSVGLPDHGTTIQFTLPLTFEP